MSARKESVMKQYSYQLNGNPIPLIANVESRVWSEYKKNSLVYNITLSNQHNGRPFLKGPLHVDYLFVFDKEMKPQDMQASSRPNTLTSYVRFIESIAKESVFNPMAVMSFTAKRVHDPEAKTQFTVTLLEEL
jgi:hypothetical protein